MALLLVDMQVVTCLKIVKLKGIWAFYFIVVIFFLFAKFYIFLINICISICVSIGRNDKMQKCKIPISFLLSREICL